ncbi:MAG: flagellar biosynthetic protein FliO [Deltaproteobacteria bacterium]|nr:flagellar biosynthetic protein FliO [Deltaproteobacteria bacterium]
MESVSFAWSFFKMLAALAIVIAMMIGTACVLKKYFYRSPETAGGNPMIHILADRYLGPKNSILLVDVLGQVMLLGVSANQISALGTISDPKAIESLKNIQLQPRALPISESLRRCRSLFRNIGQLRKGK